MFKPKPILFIGPLALLCLLAWSYSSFLDKDIPETQSSKNIFPSVPLAQKTYISEKLGIRFTYNEIGFSGQKVLINEVNNKITISTLGNPNDQFIEVFTKDPKDSLQKAIEKQFLQGIPSTDCFVVLDDENNRITGLYDKESSVVRAFIKYKKTNIPEDEPFEGSERCPALYTATNDAVYFEYDTKIPTKYIFLAIGQDGPTFDGNPPVNDTWTGWQSSIKILPN